MPSSSASAERVVSAVEAGPEGLVALSRVEDPAVALQSLPPRAYQRLWPAVAQHVAHALQQVQPALTDGGSDDVDAQVEAGLATLHAAAILVRACAADSSRDPPADLLNVSVALHDIIFDLTDERASQLQVAVVEMCESWWLAEVAGADSLVPQMVVFLLLRALQDAASIADVKRLYACRSALKVLDYSDPSVAQLKKLLLHCVIKPQILRAAEGRKLLVFLFGLHPLFIDELHRAIKAQIPHCRKSMRGLYGEVYFRAWRAATGPYLEKMEADVLQDLMFHAVHASSTAMANALVQVLAYTHEQKRQRGVDQMLLRLYDPILWRALNVANPHVRRNAASIFIEAFPLQDPTKPNVELDELMQKQFDALQTLLKDDVIAVRVIGVQGVARVLCLFWELIPLNTSRSLLELLTKELAHDAASNSVRVAAFQGLKYMLANATSSSCASVLKSVWSSLAPLINDGSERVRASMLDFLLESSKTRTLHWQFLLKPEVALARLPLERAALQQRITRLLLPLYMPHGRTAPLQLARLIALVKGHPQAATIMLRHTPTFSTPAASVRMLRLLLAATISAAEPAELVGASDVSSLPARTEPLPQSELMALTSAVATVIEALGPLLADPAHGVARASLLCGFDGPAMELLEEAVRPSHAAQRSLMAIAAWLPADAVPNLSGGALCLDVFS